MPFGLDGSVERLNLEHPYDVPGVVAMPSWRRAPRTGPGSSTRPNHRPSPVSGNVCPVLHRILFGSRTSSEGRRDAAKEPSDVGCPSVGLGPGVTSPKSRPQGCRAGHAGFESFPLVLPGPLLAGALGVGEEPAVDGVADVALQRPEGFPGGLALGHAPVEVGATVRVGLAELADGGHVDGVVELAVPALRDPVHDPATRGELD